MAKKIDTKWPVALLITNIDLSNRNHLESKETKNVDIYNNSKTVLLVFKTGQVLKVVSDTATRGKNMKFCSWGQKKVIKMQTDKNNNKKKKLYFT